MTTVIVALCSYLVGAGIFIYDARRHAVRANQAERERDTYRRELLRALRSRGELHFMDGPIIVTDCETEEQFLARLMRPRQEAGR